MVRSFLPTGHAVSVMFQLKVPITAAQLLVLSFSYATRTSSYVTLKSDKSAVTTSPAFPVASQRPHISSLSSSTLIDGCVLSAKDPYLLYTSITRHTWPRHLTISLSESIENCLLVAILGSKCMHFIVNNLHTRIIYNYTHHTKNRIKTQLNFRCILLYIFYIL